MSISPGRTFFQGKPIYPLTYFRERFIPPVSSMLPRIKRFEKQGHRMFPFQSLIHSLFRDQWLGAISSFFFFFCFYPSCSFLFFNLSFFSYIYRAIFSSFKFVEIRIFNGIKLELLNYWKRKIKFRKKKRKWRFIKIARLDGRWLRERNYHEFGQIDK